MTEEPQSNQRGEVATVQALRDYLSIPDIISDADIATAINAMTTASDWMLRQVPKEDRDAAGVEDHITFTFSRTRPAGVKGDEFVSIGHDGSVTAAIHGDALTRLAEQPANRDEAWLMPKGASQVFGDRAFTTIEYFEAMAIEATVHALQAKGVKGFSSPPKATPTPDLFKQRLFGPKYEDSDHEFQALEYKYKFFEEKYKGTNTTNPCSAKWNSARTRKMLRDRGSPDT